ncbi:hypothetical protein FHX81_0953 [Saccharothrix saharensis]|uniref:Uncharacterized protein n=1 Tax=Saccharothrix saharensis TaxID=571190 RepID=A0A543J781_9PSEU|nr:hypothetical protein FHX81_0953 [Saccharothrix saharensis]
MYRSNALRGSWSRTNPVASMRTGRGAVGQRPVQPRPARWAGHVRPAPRVPSGGPSSARGGRPPGARRRGPRVQGGCRATRRRPGTVRFRISTSARGRSRIRRPHRGRPPRTTRRTGTTRRPGRAPSPVRAAPRAPPPRRQGGTGTPRLIRAATNPAFHRRITGHVRRRSRPSTSTPASRRLRTDAIAASWSGHGHVHRGRRTRWTARLSGGSSTDADSLRDRVRGSLAADCLHGADRPVRNATTTPLVADRRSAECRSTTRGTTSASRRTCPWPAASKPTR